MRLLLLILMIALLPLRGWIGDVMAMEMAAGQLVAIQNVAFSSYSSRAGASIPLKLGVSRSECHELVPAGMGSDVGLNTTEPPSGATHGDCGYCSACQICHTAAVLCATPVHVSRPLPPLLQQERPMQFASATPAPRLKPPIS